MVALWCNDIGFKNIEAVLFDKDGTLADSHAFLKKLAGTRAYLLEQQVPGVADSLMAAFGCQGEAYDPAGLMAVGTRYENEIAAATYVAATGYPWGEALEVAKAAFSESDRHFTRKAEFTPPFPHIPQLLQDLFAAGVRIAVLSGDTTANVQDFLACYQLASFVTWWDGSEKPPLKPDPQMVWHACQQLNVAPANSIIIGDSVLDYQLAHQSQARGFVSVTWGGSPDISLADVVLHHPEQLRLSPD